MWAALGFVTLIPFALAASAAFRPGRAAPVWLLLLTQTTVLLNVLWHFGAAVLLFGGYAPGLVTAVLLNLPFSALVPSALVIHGPVLSGLLLLTERL